MAAFAAKLTKSSCHCTSAFAIFSSMRAMVWGMSSASRSCSDVRSGRTTMNEQTYAEVVEGDVCSWDV